MDVSDIQKQLDMGAPIEHEHTNNQKLAVEIALQHLDEIPDYYTRLKKMEASAKKEHKKFKDVKEDAVTDLQRGIVELDDASYANIDKVMRGIMKKRKVTAKQLHDDFVDKNNQTPDTWAKKNMKEEKKKTLRNTNPCWKGYTDIGTKMKKGRKVPNCVPVKEATEMKRYCPKCAKDETRDECKYGQKYWDMFSMPIMLKDYTPNTPHPGNMPEEKDHEYSMARSELSTIVTAAKRLRKKIGKGEGNLKSWVQSKITKAADYIDTAADYIDSGEMKKESVSIEDANGNHYAQFIDIIKPQPLKASRGIGSRLLGESKSFNNFMIEAKKSEMKCNSPKSQPVGDSLTGKSHVVKACEDGKEKLIRFGQRGVKGSPKKKGESKEYASRRNRFKTRHAKNIAKGKMSAAYWSNLVKW